MKRLFFLASVIAVIFCCQIFDEDEKSNELNSDESIVFVENIDRVDFPAAAVKIDSIQFIHDQLFIYVNYSGGREEHLFQLYVWRGLSKSNPPQAEIFLSHENHNESCEALLTNKLKFNFAKMKAYFSIA